MADKMSAMAAVRAGYASGVQSLGITRTFDENARPPVRTSDVIISATPITTTAVTLATVPEGENWRIEHLAFHNVTAGALTLAVFLVPKGGSPSATGNRIYSASVPASGTVKIDGAIGYALAAGERLMANGGTGAQFVAVGRLTRITQGAT